MSEKAKAEPVSITESSDYREVQADLCAITGFKTPANNYINIAFFSPAVVHIGDQNGMPSSSKVLIKKVSSVTMSIERARELHKALALSLEQHTEVGGN